MNYRLGILETHPIQYKAPWFRALHAHGGVDLTVFYAMLPDATRQGVGFGIDMEWDIPLLDGYPYDVLDNRARHPSVCRFGGCHTPGVTARIGGRGAKTAAPWDAWIINGWVVRSCLQALRGCRRAGVPAILRCEANDLRPRAWWKTVIHRAILRQFSVFMYIGQSNRDFYLRRGVQPDRLVEGLYAVDNDTFARRSAEARRERASLRRRWALPEDAIVFLFCGKFEPKKRPFDLLQALRLASDSLPAHVLMVGDGALRVECEAMVRRHALPVRFAGFLNQSEMPAAYAVSDCLVLPSDNGETWGLVVNEAMACGLPAVVSDQVGCHPDLIHDGLTGYTYPCGDVAALSQRLHSLAHARPHLTALGAEAHRAIARYSIAALVDGTLAAVAKAVLTSRPGSRSG